MPRVAAAVGRSTAERHDTIVGSAAPVGTAPCREPCRVAPTTQLMSVTEASQWLGISRASLYRLVRSGAVPSVRIGSRRLFRPDDLAAFVATIVSSTIL